MAIRIHDYQLPDDTHNLYDVTFYGDIIHTLVTTSPPMVDDWISQTEHLHRHSLNHLVVGLDVEWRPNFNANQDNPVATVQLCVGLRCLIFQPIHAPYIPQSISHFLANDSYTFVGVGIESDVEKLVYDYGLSVARRVDLCGLAVSGMNRPDLRNAGLKTLALEVLDKEVVKPRRVTTSRWDNQWLSAQQVQYACIDAYVSFKIGMILEAWR